MRGERDQRGAIERRARPASRVDRTLRVETRQFVDELRRFGLMPRGSGERRGITGKCRREARRDFVADEVAR